MNRVQIDFSRNQPVFSDTVVGYIGEHNATELIIIPPAAFVENEVITSYAIAFVTGGKVVRSEPLEKAETLSVKLWRQLTMFPILGVQLEAYDNNGEFIGKSRYINGLRLLPSADGNDIPTDKDNSDIVSQVIRNSKERHAHQNRETLDKLSTSKNGNLLFEGKEIKGDGSASLDIEIKTDTEDEYVLEIITDTETITTSNLKGKEGKQGASGVYVGSGDMPDGYNVQIDPNGESYAISASDISYTPADTSVIDMPNVQVALDTLIFTMGEIVNEYTTVDKVNELINEKLGVIENGYY